MTTYEQVASMTFQTKDYKHRHQVKEAVAARRVKLIYFR